MQNTFDYYGLKFYLDLLGRHLVPPIPNDGHGNPTGRILKHREGDTHLVLVTVKSRNLPLYFKLFELDVGFKIYLLVSSRSSIGLIS